MHGVTTKIGNAHGIISAETEGDDCSTAIFRVKQPKQNATPKRRYVITG